MAKPAKKRIDRVKPLSPEEAKEKSKDERSKKCRYCTNTKDSRRFYLSEDFLDTDGKLSVCIDCCTYLFNYFYSLHGRIDIALYELCKILNYKYDSKAYSKLMKALEKNSMQATIDAINGEESDDTMRTEDEIAVDTKTSLFGKYLSILRGMYKGFKEKDTTDVNLSFDIYSSDRPEGYEDKSTDKPVSEVINEIYASKLNSFEKKWGVGLNEDEYSYLESEYAGWAKNKDTDEKSVDLLIREICLQQLAIRRKRDHGDTPTKSDIDTLTTLMDKCNVTPDKLKENTSQKANNAWGVWIKDVETMSPAEWIENQKLFKDVEGIEEYVDHNFGRALRNYIGMSRDFRTVAAKLDEEANNSIFDDVEYDVEELQDGELSEMSQDGDTDG